MTAGQMTGRGSGDLLGILGGMGPLATADFLTKLIQMTPASCDQEHIATLVYSLPQIPDRTAAILGQGASPLPDLLRGLALLQEAGATCIAIPCNTAYYWYAEMAAASSVPILHIVESVCDDLRRRGIPGGPVGVLGTPGMQRSGIYQGYLQRQGYAPLLPDVETLEALVGPGIALVKAGDVAAARALLAEAADRLLAQGAQCVVLGCTEIPVALADQSDEARMRYIDSNAALATACVAWARARTDKDVAAA